jgi:putative flippase GtrA
MSSTISKLKAMLIAHKQIILYLFFGVCTTAINTASYWLLYDVLHFGNLLSTILAWLAAVIFAFITNKLFVFESKRTSTQVCINEVVSFFGCRLLTGILDVVIMAVAVDLLKWSGLLWKLISNIVVTIINYFASKRIIFRDTRNNQ